MNIIKNLILFLGITLLTFGLVKADALAPLLSEIKAAAVAKKPISLNKLSSQFFNQLNIPAPIKSAINFSGDLSNVTIGEKDKLPSVVGLRGIEKVQYDGVASFGGTMLFGKQSVQAEFNVYEDRSNSRFFSAVFTFKSGTKPSDILPMLKALDIFSLPTLQVILTSFPYSLSQQVNEYSYVQEGANIVALVDLSGPFAQLGEIKKSIKNTDAIIINMQGKVQLAGAISLKGALSYKMVVPFRIGMDLTKIKQIPAGFSKEIQKITTDDLIVALSVNPLKGQVAVSLQDGIRINLRSQKAPLVMQAFGKLNIATTDFSLGGKIPNMIELNYVSIGDLGIELYSEAEARAALLGFPFTGIGLRGRIELGKPSDSRASLTAAGKLSGRGLVFDVIGQHLNFTDLIQLVSQAATKAKVAKPLPKGSVPTIKLNRVRGKFAPFGGSVAGRDISTGLALEMDMTLFDKNFGVLADVDLDRMRFESKGWMPKTELKIGNSMIMSLGGTGKDKRANTADDGPYMHAVFDMTNPTAAAFNLSADLQIPALKLRGLVDLSYAYGKYVGSLESSAVGFGAKFNFNIDPVKWRDMYVAFDFKDDFNEFLSKQAKPALEDLKKKSTTELADIDKKIKELTDKISGSTSKVANPEIAKTKKTISRIKKKIAALEKECEDANVLEKAVVCTRVGIELAAQKTALTAQQTYLNGLAATKTIVKVAASAVNSLKNELKVEQNSRKLIAETINTINSAIDSIIKKKKLFTVKKVSGGVSALDISRGKVPLIKELDTTVTIPGKKAIRVKLKNVEFDFAKPEQSAETIAARLLKAVKI